MEKFHCSQPSNEVKVSEKLQARQRVHQTAIGSTEHSVDFQPSIGTLRKSLGKADTDHEEVPTYSGGQSETNTFSFPDSCGRGRGNFELQANNSCGLQHLI